MASIHIEGSSPAELPREPYDLRRFHAGSHGSRCRSVCYAPFVSLHMKSDGTVTPCRFTRRVVGNAKEKTLADWWNGEAVQQTRERFADYRVVREECDSCVQLWEEELYLESPATQEFDALSEPMSPAAPPMALSVEINGTLLNDVEAQIREWLPALKRLDLLLSPQSTLSSIEELVKAALALPKDQRPLMRLFVTGRVVSADEIPEGTSSLDLFLEMQSASLPPDEEEKLRELASRCVHREIPLNVHVTLGRSNWMHVYPWLQRALETGSQLTPELTPRTDPDSLAHLSGDMHSSVCDALWRWASDASTSAKQACGLDRLIVRLRRWQRDAALDAKEGPSIAFPDLHHPVLADERAAIHFLAAFLRNYHSPHVERWLHRLAAEPDFVTEAERRPSLRLAAYWLYEVFGFEGILESLRAVFRTPTHALELIAKDQEAVAGGPFDGWLRSWSKSLRLDQIHSRRIAFHLPPRVDAPSHPLPKLTVLIPSFNHGKFLKSCIESVLAQSHNDFQLRIVDDGSKDDSVAVARSFTDSRIEVSVNKTNLGLGPSIAAALKTVTTEYVAILNSDDLFHPDRLKRSLEKFEEQSQVAVVATDHVLIDAVGRQCSFEDSSPVLDGKRLHDWLRWYSSQKEKNFSPEKLLGALLERNFLLTSSNIVARRDYLERHSSLWTHLEYCLDWQIFLGAALEKRLAYLSEPLLGYRLHHGNTIWWNEERQWRYYVEANQVVARTLEMIFQHERHLGRAPLREVLDAITDHLSRNSTVDWHGVYLGALLLRLGLTVSDLKDMEVKERIRVLDEVRGMRIKADDLFRQFGHEVGELWRIHGERPYLESVRTAYESLRHEHERVRSEVTGLLWDRSNVESLWHDAEKVRNAAIQQSQVTDRERDAALKSLAETEAARDVALQSRAKIEEEMDLLQHDRADTAKERDEALKTLDLARLEFREHAARAAEHLRELEAKSSELQTASLRQLERATTERDELKSFLAQRTRERDLLLRSPQYRLGRLCLDHLRMRVPLRILELAYASTTHGLHVLHLRMDRLFHAFSRRKKPYRTIQSICWNFPIYSQTFVYQEILQLRRNGFDAKILYSKLDPKEYLHRQFEELWGTKRKLTLDRNINRKDYERYRRRMPQRIEELLQMLTTASGLSREELENHDNFLQSFSFARMVEAYRPDYLHSYFFYDRSLMALVAAFVLRIPRGVSCYADHRMRDYELKLVPLHMKLCGVVIATSARIKKELLELAPDTDPEKILVKPNAINADHFPVVKRVEPASGQPFRLVSVCRIEPKKGLLFLIDAIQLLRQRGLNVEYHLVGEPDRGIQSSLDYKSLIDRRLTELNLWGKVHLEGRQNEEGVRRFLSLSQLFVAPFVETEQGDKDGIPTALLEAMATGIPCVATDAGSIEEVILDGVDGEIVPQRNSTALADAIETLLKDSAQRNLFSTRGSQKIREQFDVKVCEKLFHDRVLALIAQHRKDGAAST